MKKLPFYLICVMAISSISWLNAHAKDGWSVFATMGLGEKGEQTDTYTYIDADDTYDPYDDTTETASDPMNQVIGLQYRQGRNAFEFHQFSVSYEIITSNKSVNPIPGEPYDYSSTTKYDVEFSGTTLAYVYFPDKEESQLQPFFKLGRTSVDNTIKGTTERNRYTYETQNRNLKESGVSNLMAGGFEYAADDAVSLIVGVSFYDSDYSFTDIGVKYSF